MPLGLSRLIPDNESWLAAIGPFEAGRFIEGVHVSTSLVSGAPAPSTTLFFSAVCVEDYAWFAGMAGQDDVLGQPGALFQPTDDGVVFPFTQPCVFLIPLEPMFFPLGVRFQRQSWLGFLTRNDSGADLYASVAVEAGRGFLGSAFRRDRREFKI